MHYRICVQGHLDPSWQERLEGLSVEQQEAGTALLSGELPDQAALQGCSYGSFGSVWCCSRLRPARLQEGKRPQTAREDEMSLWDVCRDHLVWERTELFCSLVVVVQIWLITDALYKLLSGRSEHLIWLALGCGIGFMLTLMVACWPRRSIENTSCRNHY